MFIGHYGVSFLVKRVAPAIPLWVLFLAVQFVDVLWAPLILLGVEQATISDAHRGSLPLDLKYMPYTHSLLAALGWSFLAYGVCRWFTRRSKSVVQATPLLVAVAVFSHWVLDWFVHRPDLPLYGDAHKVGLALWNHPLPALALETGVFFAGLWFYFRGVASMRFRAKYPFVLLGAAILLIQVTVFWFRVLPNASVAAIVFLAGYLLLAYFANWLESRNRRLSGKTQLTN